MNENPASKAPMRQPTSIELWAFLAGMTGWFDEPIVKLEQRIRRADRAERTAMRGLEK